MIEAAERMERLWAYHGPDLGAGMHTQAMVALATAFALLFIAVEILSFSWKVRARFVTVNDPMFVSWVIFLSIPILVMSIILTSSDLWMAAFGQTNPMIASYALRGYDAPASGEYPIPDFTTLTWAISSSLSGRAFQSIWPAALIAAVSATWLHYKWKKGIVINDWTFGTVVLAAISFLSFAPVVLNLTLWGAIFGDGLSLYTAILRPSVVLP